MLWVIVRSLKWPLLAPIPGRAALVLFTMCQPLLLNKFVGYLQEPENADSVNQGYGFILAYTATYLGIAVSTNLSREKHVSDILYRYRVVFIGSACTAHLS